MPYFDIVRLRFVYKQMEPRVQQYKNSVCEMLWTCQMYWKFKKNILNFVAPISIWDKHLVRCGTTVPIMLGVM